MIEHHAKLTALLDGGAPVREGRHWVFPSGDRRPVISGGSDDGDDSGDGDDGGHTGDDADGDDDTVTITKADFAKLQSIDALTARLDQLDKRASSRPKSEREKLLEDVQEALGIRSEASQERGRARDVTNAADEAVHRLTEKIRLGEVERFASKFRNPELAAKYVLTQLPKDDHTDDAAVKKALTDLATAEPYLLSKQADLDMSSGRQKIEDEGMRDFVDQIAKGRTQ